MSLREKLGQLVETHSRRMLEEVVQLLTEEMAGSVMPAKRPVGRSRTIKAPPVGRPRATGALLAKKQAVMAKARAAKEAKRIAALAVPEAPPRPATPRKTSKRSRPRKGVGPSA